VTDTLSLGDLFDGLKRHIKLTGRDELPDRQENAKLTESIGDLRLPIAACESKTAKPKLGTEFA